MGTGYRRRATSDTHGGDNDLRKGEKTRSFLRGWLNMEALPRGRERKARHPVAGTRRHVTARQRILH